MEKYESVARADYYASKKVKFDAVLDEGDTFSNDILFKIIGKMIERLNGQ